MVHKKFCKFCCNFVASNSPDDYCDDMCRNLAETRNKVQVLVKEHPWPWTERISKDPMAPDCFYVCIEDAKGRKVIGIDCDDDGIGDLFLRLVGKEIAD